MKITRVDARPVTIDTVPDFSIVSAAGAHRVSAYVLVRVMTDTGAAGYGEASVMPEWSGETQDGASRAIVEILGPAVTGRDPFDVNAALDVMDLALEGWPFTKAAIEMALIDLTGKLLGVPASVLIGGARRGPVVPLRFSIGAFSPDQSARVAETAVGMGFRAVKVKVGLDPATDMARVRAVRSVLAPPGRVAVDANGGWKTVDDVLMLLPELERLEVNTIEEPLPRRHYKDCARLRHHTAIPLMLDESIFTPSDAMEAIRHDACDLINLYPGKNGGIWRSIQIAHLADAAGLSCVIGSNLEWAIGSSAMAQLATVIPNLSTAVDHDIIGPLYHARSMCSASVAIHRGSARVLPGAGLGAVVDPDVFGD